jgi:hypothetical protein
MFDAVRTVAEQSFFAVAEPADDRSFGVAAAQVPRWLVATVGFEQGSLAGYVSCTIPEKLAQGLFDAFTGRDRRPRADSAASSMTWSANSRTWCAARG